ncbi:MAG: ATP-dependent helicase HrpB [Muribaculaceae bacterium]
MNIFDSQYIHSLPVGAVAAEVNEQLQAHSRLVVTAPPGAGKSTLLPLTILHSIPEGKVIVLEPRRIAACQIAERMAAMLGERVGDSVGYRVRFDSKVSRNTRLEVVTEGILTRMIVDDSTLDGISAVIFDEFHERSLASDVALALVREVQQLLRPDLKIVVMSATIDAHAICSAIDAPLIVSEGKMHEVEIHHSHEASPENCAELVARTIAMAHRSHEGDILAFLPGQAEIMRCMEMLGSSLPATVVCPLYGLLSPAQQRDAILPHRNGLRKVVLATPVAETSLTIEGVRVVVDSGLCRTLVFDARNSLSHLETVRISLDMACQRSGRAGRVAAGVCYRLWSKATELRMDDSRSPEILSADLAPVTLDVAAWDGSRIADLPWLTPPPRAHIAQAEKLLHGLGAIDDNGIITPHGRSLQAIPCHPRIAQMIAIAHNAEEKCLAADVAAILEERDPMAADQSADINLRIAVMRSARARSAAGRWSRTISIAAQYLKIAKSSLIDNSAPDPFVTGRLIAHAYPERIAVADGHCTFRLASSNRVTIDASDALAGYDALAVASLASRIFLASPLRLGDVADMASDFHNVSWNSREGRIIAQLEQRIGSLVIASRPLAGNDIEQKRIQVICNAVKREGLSLLSFSDDVLRLQRRILTVAGWHPELSLPDVSTDAILARADEWLPLYIGKASSAAELRKIDMNEVIWGMLDYDAQLAIDRIAPSTIRVPSGSNIRIDYRLAAEAPVLSVRLQECFGMTDTPRLDGGTRPILMELLSPGFKPVQLTQDLANFWQSTYFEVRKELRRRYPKHSWPDNPLEAPATRTTRRN